jgi:hypothetical protein
MSLFIHRPRPKSNSKLIGFLEVTFDSAQTLSNPFSKCYHAGAGIRIKNDVLSLQGRLPSEVCVNLI